MRGGGRGLPCGSVWEHVGRMGRMGRMGDVSLG
jgi:hypothetical protein